MKILFFGDVVGECGRKALFEHIQAVKEKTKADLVIVNGENAAHGKGITFKIYQKFKDSGADIITLGNHAFAKNVINEYIDQCFDMVRPCNMEPLNIGKNFIIKTVKGKRVMVINVCGEVFMDNIADSPYNAVRKIMDKNKADIIFVDFHGEATAEKRTFFEIFKKEITAVCGTHTHVQTADEMVDDGCAFISDVGMCGAVYSVLGRDVDEVVKRTVYGEKTRFIPAEGDAMVCGVIIDIDDETNRAKSIERIQIKPIQA